VIAKAEQEGAKKEEKNTKAKDKPKKDDKKDEGEKKEKAPAAAKKADKKPVFKLTHECASEGGKATDITIVNGFSVKKVAQIVAHFKAAGYTVDTLAV